MQTRFNPNIVLLSVLVAILASYVALDLVGRITQARGRAQAWWLACGALAMGIGIWSMHFIGMLAFEMPGMTMAYDVPLMVLSILVAVGASALALFIVSRPVVPLVSIISGGIAMAAAIAGMHYIGMFSMRMDAYIVWDLFLVVLSIVIALVASFLALLVAIKIRDRSENSKLQSIAAVILGFAIVGMHYVGMFAATFVHTEAQGSQDTASLMVTSGLTIAVVVTTLVILGIALVGTVGEKIFTSRKKYSDEILGRSEQRFRHLVDAVKDYAIIMLDPSGCVTTWNSGAQRITGYSSKDIIGKHVSIFYPDSATAAVAIEQELNIAVTAGHFETEAYRLKKDGSQFIANVVITPLYDDHKQLVGFSKVTRDITKLKETEATLHKLNEELEALVAERTQEVLSREHQLRTMADAAPILLAQMDSKERFVFVNEAFCNWFNITFEDAIGKPFSGILGDERYPQNEPFLKRALAGETVTYERRSSNGKIWADLQITYVPEMSAELGVTSIILVASDITQFKQTVFELAKAKEAAEVANSTKSAFLANMSHEIRTPLGAVLGFSELMLTHELNAQEKVHAVEVIKRNGRLLSNIINDILDLSKVEAGKLEVERVDVPFVEVMSEISSLLNLEATEKAVRLKVTTEGAIPNKIQTDPIRLRQILLNVVGNAIKFTERGSVEVKVKLVPNSKGEMQLAFIVKDTGEGISPEQASKLFTPFTQADVSTTRRFGGTGLGLVLSRKLAQALGGDVKLMESELKVGSTFMVTIDPGHTEEEFVVLPTADKKPQPSLPVNLHDLRVLVVDDSPDNQALISKLLGLAGAQVETADNGRVGVEKALSGNFNLVLMDLQMPEMDGYAATKALRDRGYGKPIIALTAHAMKEERKRCLESGFNDHLTKPVDRASLLKTLREFSA